MTKPQALKLHNEDEVIVKKNVSLGIEAEFSAQICGDPIETEDVIYLDMTANGANYRLSHKDVR